MDYTEYKFTVPEAAREFSADVLPSFFEETSMESFEADGDGLKAYAPKGSISTDEIQDILDTFVAAFPMAEGIGFETAVVEDRNWNETWEKESFRSVMFGNSCVVHSPAATDVPNVEYDILIDPKQAFGSGSHETTTLMINRILAADLKGMSAVDVGCGTAVLAILAKKKGAAKVGAFDIDHWAYENALVNVELNGIKDIDLRLGGFEVMPDGPFDFIFANITRNILLDGLTSYAKVAEKGTRLFMSGFFPEDVAFVIEQSANFGFQFVDSSDLNGWAYVECVKL